MKRMNWVWVVIVLTAMCICACDKDDTENAPVSYSQIRSDSQNQDRIDWYVEFTPIDNSDRPADGLNYHLIGLRDFDDESSATTLGVVFDDPGIEITNDFAQNPFSLEGDGTVQLGLYPGTTIGFTVFYRFYDSHAVLHDITEHGTFTLPGLFGQVTAPLDFSLFDNDYTVDWELGSDNQVQGAYVRSFNQTGDLDEEVFDIDPTARSFTFPRNCVERFGDNSSWEIDIYSGSYQYSGHMLITCLDITAMGVFIGGEGTAKMPGISR